MNKINIIAEAGTNNNGRLDKAIELVDIAKRCGADFIKFQIIYTSGLYLPGNYPYGHYDIEKVRKIRDEGILTDEEYQNLNRYCLEVGLPFTASIFDKRGTELMVNLNAPFIKIASGDLNNITLLRQVAETGKKIIISTGMSTFKDIELAVTELQKRGNNDIVLMHCVSVYPAYLQQTNLRFIEILKKEFGFPVGFSDHTEDNIASCMALSLGATWFEKHFTANRSQEGLDHAHAMEEEGLKRYIDDLHRANEAIQLREEKISNEEYFTRKRARRSLYAAVNIEPGELITEEKVLIVRPENEMNAEDIDIVIGSLAKFKINQYEPFTLEKIEKS
jgi:N,N'-diacetyllegionaminate synthase